MSDRLDVMNKNRSQNKQFDGTANTLPVNSTLSVLERTGGINMFERLIAILVASSVTGTALLGYAEPTISKDDIPSDIPANVRTWIEGLRSGVPEERANAIWKLLPMREHAALAMPDLIALLGDDTPYPIKRGPSSRWGYFPTEPRTIGESVAIQLAQVGEPVEGALMAALTNEDWQVRANAIWALGDCGFQKRSGAAVKEEVFIVALKDGHPRVREYAANALFALWQSGTESRSNGVATLIAMLHDEHLPVRVTAANALEHAKNLAAIEPLIACLAEPSAADLAAVAVDARCDQVQGRKAIFALRTKHPHIAFQDEFGSCGSFVSYLHTLDDTIQPGVYAQHKETDSLIICETAKTIHLENATVREALDAFAEKGRCRWIATIRSDGKIRIAFKDKDTNPYSVLRGAAARALGAIGDRSAVVPLIAVLKDKDPYVRRKAASALMSVKDARVVKPLRKAMGDEDWRVRSMALSALASQNAPGLLESVIAALDDKHPNVRIRAAGILKNPKAVEPLIALLTDDNHAVRGAAAQALGELKDSRAMEPLIAMVLKEDRWEIPRIPGLQALAKLGHAGAARALQEYGFHRSDWNEWWGQNNEDLLRSR